MQLSAPNLAELVPENFIPENEIEADVAYIFPSKPEVERPQTLSPFNSPAIRYILIVTVVD